MKSLSSEMKKLPFFEEIKYKDLSNIQNIQENENEKDKNKNIKINKEIDTININKISISGDRIYLFLVQEKYTL